jgi:hypothetical protein
VERFAQIDVDDSNREAYRELDLAGIMTVGRGFSGGRDSIYRLTQDRFEHKAELLACSQKIT